MANPQSLRQCLKKFTAFNKTLSHWLRLENCSTLLGQAWPSFRSIAWAIPFRITGHVPHMERPKDPHGRILLDPTGFKEKRPARYCRMGFLLKAFEKCKSNIFEGTEKDGTITCCHLHGWAAWQWQIALIPAQGCSLSVQACHPLCLGWPMVGLHTSSGNDPWKGWCHSIALSLFESWTWNSYSSTVHFSISLDRDALIERLPDVKLVWSVWVVSWWSGLSLKNMGAVDISCI